MYRVSNTNTSSSSVIRVYSDSTMIAEQYINKRNPLGYVRKHPGSKHLSELKSQCVGAGMTAAEFEGLIA